MKIECTLGYYFFYYPSKRARKLRVSYREKTEYAEIKEVMRQEVEAAAFLPDANYISYEGRFYTKKHKMNLASMFYTRFGVRNFSIENDTMCQQITEEEMAGIPKELIDTEATEKSLETARAKMKGMAKRYLIVHFGPSKYDEIPFEVAPEPYISVERCFNGKRDITIQTCLDRVYLNPVCEYRLSEAPLVLKKYNDLSEESKETLKNIDIPVGGEKLFSYPFAYESKIDSRYEYNRTKGVYLCNLICYEDLSEYKGDESWKITFVHEQEGWEFWERWQGHEGLRFDDVDKYVCEVRCVKSKNDALAAFFRFNPSVPFKNIGSAEAV